MTIKYIYAKVNIMLRKLILSISYLVVMTNLTACQPGGMAGKKAPTISISPINSLFIEERNEVDKSYKTGAAQTVYVGEALIKKRSFLTKVESKLTAETANDTVLAAENFGQVTLPKERQFDVKYDVFIDGRKFTAMEVPGKTGVIGVLFDSAGIISDKVMIDGKLLPQNFKVQPINSYVRMRRPEKILDRKTLENFEIIYGGVNNNQINMVYREYSPDDVARTAFFQELTYPTDSKTLRYKSIKLKVHNISSEGISFEVISD